MVGQVTVIGILMIVQGALEIIMGAVLVVMALVMAAVLGQAAQQQELQGGPPFPVHAVAGVYLAMAAAGLIPGALHIVAGIRGLYFRGRTFGLFSLLFGLLSIGTCYCSVTSVGLAVYGLIVYFNHNVARAFDMADRGLLPAKIKRLYYLDPERFAFADAPERESLWGPEDEPPVRADRPKPQHNRGRYYGEGFRPEH
jgi:hypothetical protein